MTPIAAPLCPACLARGIVATRNGPTCRSACAKADDWWPANWGTMTEAERVAWIEAKRKSQ